MHDSALRLFSCSFFLAVFAVACGDSGTQEQLPVNNIDLTGDGGGASCVAPSFPGDEPNLSLFQPPRFLLTTSQAQQSTSGQALVRPGDPILAEITVNSATRQVFVELADVWDARFVIASTSFQTNGTTDPISLEILPDVAGRGRYYLRLQLCGDDCNRQRVILETQPCIDDIPDAECAHNVPYVRTVINEGIPEESASTCVDLGGNPGFGSGTVLIQ